MSSYTKKGQLTQLNIDNELDILHPETEASIVTVEKNNGTTITDKYPGNADNVQDALEEVYALASTGGVTGVKGNEESTYRTGNVNLTPANIGAEAAFTDGSATIASKSGDIVTIKAGVSQTAGAIGNATGTDITLGAAAVKGVTTSVTSGSDDLVTSGAVYAAIDNLPEPMVFKGSLGTGGTIESLPVDGSATIGDTYKVITAGTYDSKTAKVGDTFICDSKTTSANTWTLIPSGDEPSGTVTSVALRNGSTSQNTINISGSPITTSGTIDVTLADNYGDTKNPYASKTKNYVLAAPANANGVPSFRALDASDIPDLSGTYQPLDADLTAIAGLTGTNGLLKKTAADTWSLDTNTYLTENQTITLTGDITGSGKTNITTTLKDSGVTAGTYSAVTVNSKGIVTAGAQMIAVGTSSTAPASLAVGGLYFKATSSTEN